MIKHNVTAFTLHGHVLVKIYGCNSVFVYELELSLLLIFTKEVKDTGLIFGSNLYIRIFKVVKNWLVRFLILNCSTY
ncbi:hypothetical protein ACE01N_03755 [Saccharicrinis sp. FJH2]|uniref:hypothetical protein n=1 Tax=Saccharicrinis sp. FJH65 TaxID=3344659 RepID=UPI0035F2748D